RSGGGRASARVCRRGVIGPAGGSVRRGGALGRAWARREVGRLGDVPKQTVSVDDVITAIETARDKVMSDEVKSLVKLGLPKDAARKLAAGRCRQRTDSEEGTEQEPGGGWSDMA